jgi:hypothetical protein
MLELADRTAAWMRGKLEKSRPLGCLPKLVTFKYQFTFRKRYLLILLLWIVYKLARVKCQFFF